MASADEAADVVEFTTENQEFLSRVLAHGGPEARGYVLAVLAHGGTISEIEAVQDELDKIKRELAE